MSDRGSRERWARRERGIAVPFVALSLVALLISTAFAVDLGRVSLKRRDLQAVADSMALDLARHLDGRDRTTIEADPAYAAALAASATRNELLPSEAQAVLGCFTAPTDTFNETCTVPDAVRVVTNGDVDYFFQPGTKSTTREAIGTTASREEAWFRVGSFLLAVNPATNSIVGQILNSVIPGASVLSYQGLASANVTLEELGLYFPITALSPEEALNTQLTMDELLIASANALAAQGGHTAEVALLNQLAAVAGTAGPFQVSDILGVDLSGGTPAGSMQLNVLQLLTSSVFLIDQTHAITVPGTTLGIPGVTSVTVATTVIEGPQRGGPGDGATAHTSQIEMTITPTLALSLTQIQNLCGLPLPERNLIGALLGGLVNLVTCLLGGVVNQVVTLQINGTIPLHFSVAGATVTQDVDCENNVLRLATQPIPTQLSAPISLTVAGSILGVSLGNLLNMNVTATGSTTSPAQTVTFANPSEIGTTKRIGPTPLGLAGLAHLVITQLTVANLNLTTLANAVRTPVLNQLNSVLGLLDTGVITPLAQTLGLSLGGADLTAESMTCDQRGVALVR